MLDKMVLKYRSIANTSLKSQLPIGNPSDQIIKFVNGERF